MSAGSGWLTDRESRRIVARMLQRLNFPFDEELYAGDGLWSRDQLEQMNQEFTAAVERAFKLGLESRAAAAATVRVGALRNGKEAAIEGAIEAAWRYLRSNMDEGRDVSFVEVLGFARERCLGVTAEQVRVGVKRRLMEVARVGGHGVIQEERIVRVSASNALPIL